MRALLAGSLVLALSLGCGGLIGGDDVRPPVPPPHAPVPPPVPVVDPDVPASWPAGFPYFPGGAPYEVAAGGPLAVTTLLYPVPPASLAEAVRTQAAREGWTITRDEDVPSSQPGTSGKVRLGFEKDGASVSVSIYEAEGKTVLLVMQ